MQKKKDAAEAVHTTKTKKLTESEQQLASAEEEIPEAEANVQRKEADLDEAQMKLEEMLKDVQGVVCSLQHNISTVLDANSQMKSLQAY
jgi:broad-specificity NMP kinase